MGVVITGENLEEGAIAIFGGVAAETLLGPGPGELTAYVPVLAPGLVALHVEGADGSTSEPVAFTVLDAPIFLRGDANLDESVDISDPVRVLLYLFAGGEVTCEDAADANDDERVDLTDAVFILDYLFRAGAAPPRPSRQAGADLTGDGTIGCSEGLPI